MPDVVDGFVVLGELYYNQGTTDRAKWHSSLWHKAEEREEGFGDELEVIFPTIWTAIAAETDYAAGKGGVYGLGGGKAQDRELAATPAVDYLMNHLEAYMVEFNPHLLAKLEKSRELQGFLQRRSIHALKTWHQCLSKGLTEIQAWELVESVLLPVPEEDDEKE